jgi:hypothetical protein
MRRRRGRKAIQETSLHDYWIFFFSVASPKACLNASYIIRKSSRMSPHYSLLVSDPPVTFLIKVFRHSREVSSFKNCQVIMLEPFAHSILLPNPSTSLSSEVVLKRATTFLVSINCSKQCWRASASSL